MAIEKINIDQFLLLAKQFPVLDARSPGEYKHAHIPDAISFPLFTDEERKIIGTAYKQESREQAIRIGLDYFGPKMRGMTDRASEILKEYSKDAASRTLLVHCWRGGMRSAAVAWLLDLFGFKVITLNGGYKAFRRYVLETFQLPFDIQLIGGYTGSGKTALLQTLHDSGSEIIDLEKVAVHKGSAFGNIGMPDQPGQEMFENLLAKELRTLKGNGPVWVEDESQRLGLVNLPNELWKTMRASRVYFLEIPFEARLEYIVQEYGGLNHEKLIGAISRISEKLGHLNAKNAISELKEGKISESFSILLKYYDKYYLRSLHNRQGINSLLQTISSKSITSENARLLTQKFESILQEN